jgi:hypothetical protein
VLSPHQNFTCNVVYLVLVKHEEVMNCKTKLLYHLTGDLLASHKLLKLSQMNEVSTCLEELVAELRQAFFCLAKSF